MAIITAVYPDKKVSTRVCIELDGRDIKFMEERVWTILRYHVGMDITLEEINKKNRIWKDRYEWEKEKERINFVKWFIETLNWPIDVEIIGFGADSLELILKHPPEHGSPDLLIKCKKNGKMILQLEVTGTDFARGDVNELWLRPDKIKFAKRHTEIDYWAAIVIGKRINFVKPDLNKNYIHTNEMIKPQEGSLDQDGEEIEEHYVKFHKGDSEVHDLKDFYIYLKQRMEKIC